MTLFRTLALFLFIHSICYATDIHHQPMDDNNSIKKQFVFAADDHAIVGVELTTGEVCGPIETTLSPKSLITSPDGKVACLLADGLEQLTVIHFEQEIPHRSLKLPCVPRGLALTNEGIGYLIQEDSLEVFRLDLSTGELESFMTLNMQPAQIHLHEKTLYISYQDSQDLTQIDLSLKKTSTCSLFKSIPKAIAPINSERIAAVEKDAEKVSVYDLKEGKLIHTISAKNDIPSHLQKDPIIQVDAAGQAGFLTYRHSNQVIPFQLAADYPDRPTTLPPQFQTIGFTRNIFVVPTTTTITQNTPNPSVLGETVTFSATVSGNSPSPTGTVSFFDGSTLLGSGNLATTNQITKAVFSYSSFTVGSHSITAVYNGDANYTGSTSLPVDQQVNNATTTVMGASPNPSTFGETVVLSATVSVVSPGSGTPSGVVTFKDGSTTLGTGTLNGSGFASLPINSLSVGNHVLTAEYGGGPDYSGSTSSPFNQVVNPSSTSVSLNSNPNPSVYGQTVTLNATVTALPPGSGVPTGTVVFMDGSTTLGSGLLNGSGGATISISDLSVGLHTLTATYQGDLNYSGANSSPIIQEVNQAATTTLLTSSVNPSAQQVIIEATVSTAGSVVPTGIVSFFESGVLISSASLDSNGKASFSTSSLSLGVHSIYAVYDGTVNFSPSNSNSIVQVVTQPQVYPPTMLQGVQKVARFLNEKEFVNILTWQPPVAGEFPLFYLIYRDPALTELVATIPASGPLSYQDHNRTKGMIYTYYIISVSETATSKPVAVTISSIK